MDPLSIAASSTRLILFCEKTTDVLHSFITGAKEVHSTITTLHDDITSLSELLTNLKLLFEKKDIGDAVVQGMDNFDGKVWKRVNGILESIQKTVTAVENLVRKFDGKKLKEKEGMTGVENGKRKGVVRRGWMQLRMEFLKGDFELRHQQLQTQRSTLQIFLASVSICLQIHTEMENEHATKTILANLEALRNAVKGLDPVKIKRTLQMANSNEPYSDSRNPFRPSKTPSGTLDKHSINDEPPNAFLTTKETEQDAQVLIENLEDTLESTKEIIHSAHASIASRRRDTVLSVASAAFTDQGSLFNVAIRSRVDDWVNDNLIEEGLSDDDKFEDIELLLSKRFLKQGEGHFGNEQFVEAEASYRLAIQHAKKSNSTPNEYQRNLQIALAAVRIKQQNWDDVEEMILPFTTADPDTINDPAHLNAYHLWAEYKLHASLLKDAEILCRKIVEKRRALLRKRDPAQESSMDLLVRIVQAKSEKLPLVTSELSGYGIDVKAPKFSIYRELRKAVLARRDSRIVELLLLLPESDINATDEWGLKVTDYASVMTNASVTEVLRKNGGIARPTQHVDFTRWKSYFASLPDYLSAIELCFRQSPTSSSYPLLQHIGKVGKIAFQQIERSMIVSNEIEFSGLNFNVGAVFRKLRSAYGINDAPTDEDTIKRCQTLLRQLDSDNLLTNRVSKSVRLLVSDLTYYIDYFNGAEYSRASPDIGNDRAGLRMVDHIMESGRGITQFIQFLAQYREYLIHLPNNPFRVDKFMESEWFTNSIRFNALLNSLELKVCKMRWDLREPYHLFRLFLKILHSCGRLKPQLQNSEAHNSDDIIVEGFLEYSLEAIGSEELSRFRDGVAVTILIEFARMWSERNRLAGRISELEQAPQLSPHDEEAIKKYIRDCKEAEQSE